MTFWEAKTISSPFKTAMERCKHGEGYVAAGPVAVIYGVCGSRAFV